MPIDPASVLLTLGFDIALEYAKAKFFGETEKNRAYSHALEERLLVTTRRIETAISNATNMIFDKVEADRLEELRARIKNVAMLVELKSREPVLQYTMTLNESLEYARNRVREGKLHWLGPAVAGGAIFLDALQYAGVAKPEHSENFHAELREFRKLALEGLRPTLMEMEGPLPWEEIAAFVRGENSEILKRLTLEAHRVLSVELPHRRPTPGEGYCFKCGRFYSTSGSKCSKCGRFNCRNFTRRSTRVCPKCLDCIDRNDDKCPKCNTPLVQLPA